MRLPAWCMSAELWQIRIRGVHPTYLFPEKRNQTYLLPPHVTLCTSHLISTLFCVQHLGNILSMIHIFLTRIRAAFYRNKMVAAFCTANAKWFLFVTNVAGSSESITMPALLLLFFKNVPLSGNVPQVANFNKVTNRARTLLCYVAVWANTEGEAQ